MRAVRRPSDRTVCGDSVDLRPADHSARAGQHRQVLADHNGVLDEDRIRAVIGGGRLPDRPAAGRQRVGIGRVLGPGQFHIHRRAADVGDDALGQPAAGPADQARAVHPIASLPDWGFHPATRRGRAIGPPLS